MKSISLLILKKRWFLFLILLFMALMANLVFWNESTQFFRNFSSIERMRIEGEKGSFESYYVPRADEDNLIIPMSLAERNKIYQAFSAMMDGGQKIYSNRTGFIEQGEPLHLLTEKEVKEALLGEELDDYLINDLLFPKGTNIESLSHELDAIGSFGLRAVSSSYQSNRDYFLNNLYFALGFSGLALLLYFFVSQWLVKASVKICQNEIRVLRVVGMGRNRLVNYFFLLFTFPIMLGILGLVFVVYTSGISLIWADLLSLCGLNGLFFLLVFLNTKRNMKEVFYD